MFLHVSIGPINKTGPILTINIYFYTVWSCWQGCGAVVFMYQTAILTSGIGPNLHISASV